MAALILLLGVIAVVHGRDLTPFIAWSTDDSLSNLGSSLSFRDVIDAVETSSAPTILLFAFDKLSFDDIAKYRGTFDTSVSSIETAMESAPHRYWNGVNLSPGDWVSDMAKKLKKTITTVKAKDIGRVNLVNGFFVIDLSSTDDFRKNDEIVGKVMKMVKKKSYTALCTELSLPSRLDEDTPTRSRRSVSGLQEDPKEKNDEVDPSCAIGGKLIHPEDNGTCMFFCLAENITFIPEASNPNATCRLFIPYKLTYNCSTGNYTDENPADDGGFIYQLYRKPYPSVTVYFTAQNNTNSTSNCSEAFWEEFSNNFTKPDKPDFDNAVMEFDVVLTFFFPYNFTYNSSSVGLDYWAVMISSVYTRRWVTVGRDEPVQYPPDEKDIGEGEWVSDRQLLVRQNPQSPFQVYQPFAVSNNNSYACSAPLSNVYVIASYDFNNGTGNILNILKRVEKNATNATSLTLNGIQVEAYRINNRSSEFRSVDNCVGYFSEVTWMGIISMSILIIIFYIAILCAFSMKSLDQFEDPRGQTISVEKLH